MWLFAFGWVGWVDCHAQPCEGHLPPVRGEPGGFGQQAGDAVHEPVPGPFCEDPGGQVQVVELLEVADDRGPMGEDVMPGPAAALLRILVVLAQARFRVVVAAAVRVRVTVFGFLSWGAGRAGCTFPPALWYSKAFSKFPNDHAKVRATVCWIAT